MADNGKKRDGVALNGAYDDQELYGGAEAAYDTAIGVHDDEELEDERERAVARYVLAFIHLFCLFLTCVD